jgi:lantibiotic modifying enzyme
MYKIPGSYRPYTKILDYCIGITKDINWTPLTIPRWYLPRHYQFTQIDQQNFPQGNFNLGLAHGISGVLGFLSIAMLEGIEIEGLKEAVRRITDWLMKKFNKRFGLWPNRVSFSYEVLDKELPYDQCSLEAWCYGTPGVARVLYLTGKALEDKVLQHGAIDAFMKILKRNHEQHSFQTPTFCHGLAGLLTLSKLMAKDTHISEFHEFSNKLENKILSFYDYKAPFGFKDREMLIKDQNLLNLSSCERSHFNEFNEYDNIGFLDGVSGILLALLLGKNEYFSWTFPLAIEGN